MATDVAIAEPSAGEPGETASGMAENLGGGPGEAAASHEAAADSTGGWCDGGAAEHEAETGAETAPPERPRREKRLSFKATAQEDACGEAAAEAVAAAAAAAAAAPKKPAAKKRRPAGREGAGERRGPCAHCGVLESPQWRKGPPKKPILCNACGTRYMRTKSLGHSDRYNAQRARAQAAAQDGAAPASPKRRKVTNRRKRVKAGGPPESDCTDPEEADSDADEVAPEEGGDGAGGEPISLDAVVADALLRAAALALEREEEQEQEREPVDHRPAVPSDAAVPQCAAENPRAARFQNRRSPAGDQRYIGVTCAVNRKGKTWQARIRGPGPDGRERAYVHLGMHNSPEAAARAFDRAAILVHGLRRAVLNFPVEDYADELGRLQRMTLPELAAEYRCRPHAPPRARAGAEAEVPACLRPPAPAPDAQGPAAPAPRLAGGERAAAGGQRQQRQQQQQMQMHAMQQVQAMQQMQYNAAAMAMQLGKYGGQPWMFGATGAAAPPLARSLAFVQRQA